MEDTAHQTAGDHRPRNFGAHPRKLNERQRVLDKVYLKEVRSCTTRSRGVSTSGAAFPGSDAQLSSPLYLGDMSFGALSGIPNIAIAKAADKSEGSLLGLARVDY
jgi:glutamate synthase domain-containing protein 2